MSYDKARTAYILEGESSPVVGDSHECPRGNKLIQGHLTGTGAISATAIIEISNEIDFAFPLYVGTITLNGTNAVSDGFAINSNPPFIRARLTSIAGNGAEFDVSIGV